MNNEELAKTLATITETLKNIERMVKSDQDRLNAHSDKIRSLEIWRGWIFGGLAAWAVIIGTIVGIYLKK